MPVTHKHIHTDDDNVDTITVSFTQSIIKRRCNVMKLSVNILQMTKKNQLKFDKIVLGFCWIKFISNLIVRNVILVMICHENRLVQHTDANVQHSVGS